MKFCNNQFVQLVRRATKPIVATALATPFKHGKIQFDDLLKLVELQQKYADCVVTLGTTAEPNALSDDERCKIIATVRLSCNLPVIAGVSANGTAAAIRQAETAQRLGADGILLSPPSFGKCTPDGYIKHVLKIASRCDLPIVLYNAPSRAGYRLSKTIVRVLAEKGVNFLKDADDNTSLTKESTMFNTKCFCGNDRLYLDFLRDGACGTISVASNVAPLLVKAVGTMAINDIASRPNPTNLKNRLHAIYCRLAELCALEINPIAIKYLLYKAKIFNTYEMRLPLTKACKNTIRQIDDFWQEHGQTLLRLNGEANV